MPRPSREAQLATVHEEALRDFNAIYVVQRPERAQALEDRRFYSISGAQWEGDIGALFENKPRPEINKVLLSVIRIFNEYRNNRITVDFVSKDGATNTDLADVCDGLYRADEQDSHAEEAYDNAFEEGVGGGMGAWRLRACYENEEDDEDERQRIRMEPIFDADTSVYFDLGAKRQDKSDAKRCYVLYSIPRQDYIEQYDDDPASWPEPNVDEACYDWRPDNKVYIAEVYKVEEKTEVVRTFAPIEGEQIKYTDAELEEMGDDLLGTEDHKRQEAIDAAIADLANAGTMEIRKRRKKTRKVRKYIMSGGKILEDCGYIAGKYIPIIPFYGKRWYVDGVERFMGQVRPAKDVQRMKNVVVGWLEEIAAQSPVEKPIFTPEQIAGHEGMWSEDNVKRYPYLLINPITGTDGSDMPAGPVGSTKPPQIPPALAALTQMLDIDMAEILGKPQEADKMVSNISGKAVEMIQQRLDMISYIFMSNFAKSMAWSGTVWLSMMQDITPEENRRMKSIGEMGNVEPVILNQRIVDEAGELTYKNDLSKADLQVVADVGPSYTSRRDATVRGLTGVLQMTKDPADAKILNALIMMNMEGEGLNDVREFYRKQLVAMQVLQPNEEERKAMEQAGEQQPSPQDIYLLSEAEKNKAETAEHEASTGLKRAQTSKTGAETLQILKETKEPANAG